MQLSFRHLHSTVSPVNGTNLRRLQAWTSTQQNRYRINMALEDSTAQQSTSPLSLDPINQRVLGALMEKEMTTPETYPLSLNALLAACNQRSSRDPVLELSEEQVRAALYTLEVASLVVPARGEGRVARYEHRIRTVLNLRRDETAILCVLLLRGPQTPGELRSRAERLFAFDDLAQVQATLDRLGSRPTPVVATIERGPGSREVRFRHCLGNQPDAPNPVAVSRPVKVSDDDVQTLRAAIERLEQRVQILEARSANESSEQ
jgi:uncharacterized protein YceH (UPF0502 family)